jgi:hypothetical protein
MKALVSILALSLVVAFTATAFAGKKTSLHKGFVRESPNDVECRY